MTAINIPIVKDHKFVTFDLDESSHFNSINDITKLRLNERKVISKRKKEDFADVFICHMIFYTVFCFALLFHILIALGFGTFITNKTLQLLRREKKPFFENNPVIALEL